MHSVTDAERRPGAGAADRSEMGIIVKARYGVIDTDRSFVMLALDVDCGHSGATALLSPEEAGALLNAALCTVDQLAGRYCLVHFERGWFIRFERLLTPLEAVSMANAALHQAVAR